MLSLCCSGKLGLGCVDVVEAIRDPRHLFKVERPESQMVEVILYMSSALLTTCSAHVQLDRCKARHYFVNHCVEVHNMQTMLAANGDEAMLAPNGDKSMSYR